MEYHAPNFTRAIFTDATMRIGEEHLRARDFVRVVVQRIVPASGARENVDSLFEIGVKGDPLWFAGGTKRTYFAQTGQLYLESLKRFSSVPHAGCGFGISRIAQFLLAESDITKDVVLPSNRDRLN